SDNTSRFVPLFWIEMDRANLLGSGAGGRLICEGVTTTTGMTLAKAITLITGKLVADVFIEISAFALASSGLIVLMINSNSLPGSLVLSRAENALLLHSGSDKVTGRSMLLTIRTVSMAFDSVSVRTLSTANEGITSINRQTVPFNWRVSVGWLLSLHVTVTVLAT